MAGETFVYSFTHSNIGTSAQITEKLTDLSQGATSDPPMGEKGCFTHLKDHAVLEMVVAETHIALLTDDGKICRIRFSEEQPPPASISATGKEKSDDEAASTTSTHSYGSRSASPRPDADTPSSSFSHVWGSIVGSGAGSAAVISGASGSGSLRVANRGRILLRRRGGGHGIVTRWPMIPAGDVPDELVDQAMAVLQGKSREMVIRELQRTNLDVNQAVNNLLSREDDDGDGSHDEGGAGFLASGEELLSLLGSGMASVGEEELDEVLGRGRGEEGGSGSGAGGRDSRLTLYEFSDPLLQARSEIRSLVSLGDSAAGGGASGGEHSKRPSSRGASSSVTVSTKKKKSVTQTALVGPVLFDSSVEWWGGEKDGYTFKHITGLYSDLLAVDSEGKLHGWAWSTPTPHPRPHPLEAALELKDETIKLLSARLLRGSLVTDSGKIATFVDRSVRGYASRLVYKAQAHSELYGENVTSLSVSELVSAVTTESGKVFWWGILPFTERKQAVSQNQEKLRLLKYQHPSGSELQEGSRVCLRSSPVYSTGTKAIHIKGTQIQCGVLQEDVMSPTLSEKCQFKVIPPYMVARGDDNMDVDKEERPEEIITVHIGTKRKHADDGPRLLSVLAPPPKTEVWSLRDVIFTDHVTNLREGSVVKIDGNYAAVHYPPLEPTELSQANLEGCRLLRKDELVLVSEAYPHQTPYFTQVTPRRLRPPSTHQLLTLATDSRGVHCLFSVRDLIHYVVFNLNTGKPSQDSQFGELSSQYLLKQGGPLQLVPVNLSLGVVLDQHGGVFPVSKNNTGNMRDLPLLNLPPASSVGVGVCSSRNSLVSVAFKKQLLIPAILRKDLSAINHLLNKFKDDPSRLTSALSERCAGGCNVFHVLAALAKPPDPTPVQQGDKKGLPTRSTPRGLLRDIMKQAMAVANNSGPPLPSMDWSSDGGNDVELNEESHDDMAFEIFDLISSIEGHTQLLTQLMQEKNLDGYTPFMAAVSVKAYGLACLTLDLAQHLSEGDVDILSMLYPTDSHPDDNPIFVLARNDTCSFTWTGEEHIQQDIFECRTCGLIGSLCCCTECAYMCHRGHDCSFKKASPTAYCDCWEVGKCRSLASGFDYERKTLLDKLLKRTSLGTKVNGRGEHLIGLLAATVARQTKEQSHWSGVRMSSSFRHSRTKHDDIVSYNLPPPRFAQKALGLAMESWECVKAVLMCGCGSGEGVEGEAHVDTSSLDAFTHILLSKLNQKTLDSLLTLLVRRIGPSRSEAEPMDAAARFVRSVIRVYTVAQVEAASLPTSASMEVASKRRSYSSSPLIERAQKVFTSLAPVAVKQLVPMARASILPVMLGIARPVDALCMSERARVCEEVFRMPLVSLLRVPACEEEGGASEEGVVGDHDTESEMGEDEPQSVGGLAHDASSTVTTGSHLVFFSDQDSSDGEDVESAQDDVSISESHDEDVVLDPPPSHRVTFGVHWALPQSRSVYTHHTSRLSRTSTMPRRDVLSMGMSASLLSQTFSILVRQLAETVDNLWDIIHSPTPPDVLPVLDSDPKELYDFLWAELEEVWVWLFNCMDMLQSQLKFGSAVNRKTFKDTLSSKHEATSEVRENRKEFFSYMLTLFRGQFGEHGGRLPAVDVTGMEHLAWTLDALYYLLQNTRPLPSPPSESQDNMDKHSSKFFRRSNSTLCLGIHPHSPFEPLVDALPLAEKPQLMDSVQDKEVLFGYQLPVPLSQWPSCPLPPPPIHSLLMTNRDVSRVVWPKQQEYRGTEGTSGVTGSELSRDEVCGWDSHKLAASILIGRWDHCIDVFARGFMDTVGKQRGSVLSLEQQFEQREKEFRREMDLLRTASHKEMIVEVDRSRNKFLSGLFQKLNHYCDHQSITGSHGSHPLAIHRLKVTFSGEPGEGSGVLRSMFTASAEAVLSDDPPPFIEMPARSFSALSASNGGGGGGRRSRDKQGSSRQSGNTSLNAVRRHSLKRSPSTLDPPLFYQPGKIGFYAPRVSTNTAERLNAYRNVGRLIGLCLLHTEVMTLPLCRHVFKYLLKGEISWHDFAFFDSGVYESLRKMILDSRNPDGAEYLSTLGLTFCVTLRPDEGGATHDLIEGAGSTPVTPDNVYEYVRKYALLRMVTVNQDPLQHMREGMYEVIPESSVSQLSAEDLRLLLCGCPHIDVDVVRGITIFDDESRKDQEQLTRFKGWFWSVFERMTQRERQDLLYFWTSSPVIPASVDSYQPPPSVTIRPPDDQHLPTANTCISRLYVPLYSSKAILRTRILTAIKTKAFGFV